jgi:hypothetical protein
LKGGFRPSPSRLHLKLLVKQKQKVYEELKKKQCDAKELVDQFREAQTIFTVQKASHNTIESVTQKKHLFVNTVLTLERSDFFFNSIPSLVCMQSY